MSSSPLSPPPSSASSLSSFTFPTSHTKAHLTLNSSIHINPFIIPPHSSLPSPLSPPLSISPPSSSFSLFNNHNHTMADTVVLSSTRLSDSLPPRHPSSPTASSTSSSHSNSSNTPSRTTALQRAGTSAPALPFIQTSPEEWLAHAAQQRRHLSTGSFSSTTSSVSSSTGRFTPDRNGLLQPQPLQQRVQSPVQLAFGESEQVVSSDDERKPQLQLHQKYITSNHNNDKRIPDTTTTANGTDAGEKQEEEGEGEQEPLLNVNVRPSELRASLMARARRSSAKLQQQQQRSQSESMLLEKGSRLSGLSNQSFSSSSASAFDSRLSRSSTSSSISGWAPRARSSSVSSHGSNDSVNLDALIAGGSDINEECPLELEDGDDMVADWSKEDLLQQQQLLDDDDDDYEQLPVQVQQGHRSRRSTGASATSSMFHDDRQSDDYCDEPEMAGEDPEYDETIKGFPQLPMKTSIPEVRGLTSPKQLRAPATRSSNRFPDGRNPFDLESDYLDTPSSSNHRLSTLSQDSSISNRSSTSSIGGSRLQPPVSRLPGASSGLKAPASRLTQPGSRTATGVPLPASKMGIARPSGMQAPKSGIQAPKSGLQAPKTGLQAPRASGLQAPRTGSSSSLVKPSATGSRLVAPGSRVPSKPGSGIAPPSATRSQIAAPGTVKRAASVSTGGRGGSTLLPPSTVTSRSASSSSLIARSGSTTATRTLANPQRASTSTNLTSPTRGIPSGRLSSASSYMISPTSSQSSTSSLPSLGHARDTVTPLSQRLSNATGTSQLMRPKTSAGGIPAPRSLSMYGSSSSLLPTSGRISQQQQHHYHGMEDEAEYTVLTPPQSPSSKRVLGNGNGYGNGSSGLPRSGMAMPSRLAAPSVSTSRVPRPASPGPLSAGSNSGSSYLRPHTPTTGLRIPSGLISPRAGRS